MPSLDFERLSAGKPKRFVFFELEKALDQSIDSSAKNVKKAAVLFSGGVDSSLCAKLVSEKVPKCVAFSVGLKGSPDLVQAKKSAKLLNLELKIIEVDGSKIPLIAKKVSSIINSNDFLQLSIAIPEFFALQEIKNSGYKIVFSGQGPDELFLGYAVFPKLLKDKGVIAVKKEQEHLFDVFERN